MLDYTLQVLVILCASAVAGIFGLVIKLWRNDIKHEAEQQAQKEHFETKMESVDARLGKIDEMKLEGTLARIETDLQYIRKILERREKV